MRRKFIKDPDLKRRYWQHHFGTKYDTEHKLTSLAPLIGKLEVEGKLGNVILDVGSGAFPISEKLIPNLDSKKIIQLDIGRGKRSELTDSKLKIQGDIENIDSKTVEQKRRLLELAKFLKIDPRRIGTPIDSIIIVDVLNYVGFEKTLLNLSRFLRPGGRLIIQNKPEKGVRQLFSEKGVKNNFELIDFFEKNGFKIEDLQIIYLDELQQPVIKTLKDIKDMNGTEGINLVVRKNE